MNEKATNQKSILDGIPVEDKAFPLGKKPEGKALQEVVSQCPACGAPIYGQRMTTETNPSVTYSCFCRMRGGDLPNVRQT